MQSSSSFNIQDFNFLALNFRSFYATQQCKLNSSKESHDTSNMKSSFLQLWKCCILYCAADHWSVTIELQQHGNLLASIYICLLGYTKSYLPLSIAHSKFKIKMTTKEVKEIALNNPNGPVDFIVFDNHISHLFLHIWM